MNALELQGLTKHYKDFTLGPLDLTLPGGTICGLIGENGSGKSTVSSIIAGMQPASSGEMFYKGKPWKPATMLEAQKAGIGMIVQEALRNDNFDAAAFVRQSEAYLRVLRPADRI